MNMQPSHGFAWAIYQLLIYSAVAKLPLPSKCCLKQPTVELTYLKENSTLKDILLRKS